MPDLRESPTVDRGGGATGGGGDGSDALCAGRSPPLRRSPLAAQRSGRILRTALSERDVRFTEYKRNASDPAELHRSALLTSASLCADPEPSSSAAGSLLNAVEGHRPFASSPRLHCGAQEASERRGRPTKAGETAATVNGSLVRLGSDSPVVGGCRTESPIGSAAGSAVDVQDTAAAGLVRRRPGSSSGSCLAQSEPPANGEALPTVALSERPCDAAAAAAAESSAAAAAAPAAVPTTGPSPAVTTGGSGYTQPTAVAAATVQQDRGRWSRLIPSYCKRSDEFRKQFKTLPEEERLLVDYSCALQKDILIHGRLYISQNWICFYANLFGWESSILVPLREVTAVNKCRTAKVIPNAIQITTTKDKFLFSSFVARDQTYLVIFRAWICALSDQPIDGPDLWSLVRWLYGLPAAEQEHTPANLLAAAERPPEESRPPSELGAGGVVTPSEKTIANDQEDRDGHLDRDEEDRGSLSSSTASCSSSGSLNEDDDSEANDCLGAVVECPNTSHEHKGVRFLDCTIDVPASQLFELLFTENSFYSDFLTKRGTTELVLSPWPNTADEDGKKKRTITYTLAINASFGPKRSPATEVQVLLPETLPGSYYALDCECLNAPTLPYGENFYVLNKYCILRLSGTRCRLIVHSEIVYVKAVFSIVKGIIHRNVTAGVKGYFQHLGEALHAISPRRNTSSVPAAQNQTPAEGDAGPTSASVPLTELPAADDEKRSVRRPSSLSVPPHGAQAFGASQQHEKSSPETATKPGRLGHRSGLLSEYVLRRRRLLGAALFLLLICNVLMSLYIWQLDLGGVDLHCYGRKDAFSAQDDVIRALLEQHQRSHDKEIERWRDLLESSSVMVNQLQHDVQELRHLMASKESISSTGS